MTGLIMGAPDTGIDLVAEHRDGSGYGNPM